MVATYVYISLSHHIFNCYHIYITINNSYPIRLRMTTAILKKNNGFPRRGAPGSWWTSRQVFCAALGTTRSRRKPLVTTRTEKK